MTTEDQTKPAATESVAPVPSAKAAAIQLTLDAINKQLGPGSIMRLGSKTALDIPTVSTGSLAIDVALGVGGLPRGRISQISGLKGAGQITLCLSLIAQAQRKGEKAAFVGVKNAFDENYASAIGIRFDRLDVHQPDSGEDALERVEKLVRSKEVGVIVLASLAAMDSKQDLGKNGRSLGRAMQRVDAVVRASQCICIFVDEIQKKCGGNLSRRRTCPIARALKLLSSVRIDITRKTELKAANGLITRIHVKGRIIKNKVAPPFGEGEFDITRDEGISQTGALLDLGIQHRILADNGGGIYYGSNFIGPDRQTAEQNLREMPQIADAIDTALRPILLKAKVPFPFKLPAAFPSALAQVVTFAAPKPPSNSRSAAGGSPPPFPTDLPAAS